MHEYHLVRENPLQKPALSHAENNCLVKEKDDNSRELVMEESRLNLQKGSQDLLVLCRVIKKSGAGPRSRNQHDSSEIKSEQEYDRLAEWECTTVEGHEAEQEVCYVEGSVLNLADKIDTPARTTLTLGRDASMENSVTP